MTWMHLLLVGVASGVVWFPALMNALEDRADDGATEGPGERVNW